MAFSRYRMEISVNRKSNVLSVVEGLKAMDYFVYIAKNQKDKIYIGQTTDLGKRILCHNSKRGALFTTKHGGFSIVYYEKHSSLLEAMRREKQLKGWSRKKKEALIVGDRKLLKIL